VGEAASPEEVARARRVVGADVDRPRRFPRDAWAAIVQRGKLQLRELHLPLLAAGVAFRVLLAVAPAIVAAISVWGLAADPDVLAAQIQQLAGQLPEEGGRFAASLLTGLTDRATGQLGGALLVTLLATLWSTSSGALGLIDGVAATYGETDTRSVWRRRGIALAAGVAGLVLLVVVVVVVTSLPQLLSGAGVDDEVARWAAWLRWPALLVVLVLVLLVTFRYGPDRARPRWRWVLPGAVLGALVWTVASIGFGVYVTRVANLDDTYGPLAGIVVAMLWAYLSAFAVLLGALLNAELERQTALDTTTGPPAPMGERGAVVADELPATYDPQQADG
jgi:membrane protein